MSGKGKGKNKKGGQLSRAQQQQQAAARRGVPGGPQGSGARADAGGRNRPLAPDVPTAARQAGGRPAGDPAPPAVAPTGPAAPAPAKVTRYVDVSAVRIQDWLGRTPDLKFRRGGSVLLSESTGSEFWKSRLPAGTRWNEEAGEVDGVVSLIVEEDAAADKEAAGDPDDRVREAARQVVQRMRATMPHCQVQAVAGRGVSYAVAYPAMDAARHAGALLVDSPPAATEALLAKPCDQCRSAAATRPQVIVTSGEKPADLCGECAARLDAAGRTAGKPSRAPLPERRLREALAAAGMEVTDFSDAFADMAAAGERDRDDKATQVALVYADGNRVGAFLTMAANTPGGPDKDKIARLLTDAALGALTRAVIDRFQGWAEPPVLVHLAGGDDILVSVPAPDAWLFTRTLLASFTAILTREAEAANWPDALRKRIPTLAAGVVFHHVKTPFSDVARLADGQLRDAKARTRGSASVAFLDMTADGNAPPKGRLPVLLTGLDKHAARLTQVAALHASRRQALLDLHRTDTQGFMARLTDFADNRPLWEIAAGPGATASAVRARLRESDGCRDEVRRALDIARHWHAEPRSEQSQEAQGR